MQTFPDLSGNLCAIFFGFSYSDYPLLIQIAIVVSFFAVCTTAFTLTYIVYNRTKKQLNNKQADEAEQLIIDELNTRLFNYDAIGEIPESEMNTTVRKLDEIQRKGAVFQIVLARVLIYFKHNLTGNISWLITSTYFRLRLNELTIHKLKSSFWFTKAQGLKELQDINDYHSVASIEPLLLNKNIDVRVEAYAALLKLQTPQSFDFLEQEKDAFSNWHQILLFEAITKSEHANIPDFGRHLESQNKSVIELTIKLILHYKQFETIPSLIQLLSNGDEKIRSEAICALGILDAEEAEQKLISIYPTERNPNKSQILISLGEISSGNALIFLKDKFLKADHYTILKSATAAIMSHPTHLRTKILETLTQLDEEQEAIIKHFEDPLIRLHGIR